MQGYGYYGQLGNGVLKQMGDGLEFSSVPVQVSGYA